MSKKSKFRPRITRVKLNPEQAVLQCECFDVESRLGAGLWGVAKDEHPTSTICSGRSRESVEICYHSSLPAEDFDHTATKYTGFVPSS